MPKPWTATYYENGKLSTKEFDKLTDALAWVDDPDGIFDPDWSSSIHLSYELNEDYEEDPDHLMALLGNRLPAKVIDGYAGGASNYRVEVGEHRFWTTDESIVFDDRDL